MINLKIDLANDLDPFDRLLTIQAQCEKLSILACDEAFADL